MSTVVRIEKNRNYVVMNNEFLRNKEMSLKAKGLLALCLSLPDTWDYSLNGLVSITKENLTAVRSGLKELQHKTPIQALGGQMSKHTISLYELIEMDSINLELWQEKIIDSTNYLFLLHALVLEKLSDAK